MLRDLVAIREAARIEGSVSPLRESDDANITNLIMRSLTTYEIRETFMFNSLRPYLDNRTEHFCHELYNFANSPYDIIGYDRHVQFTFRNSLSPPPPNDDGSSVK